MTITLDTLTLPEELIWQDEFDWDGIQASTKRTVQGKLIVSQQTAPSAAGRPITLTTDNAWIQRSDLEILQAWAQDMTKTMLLIMHNGVNYNVRFRHWEKPVLSGSPLIDIADHSADTWYILQLKLVVI